MTPSLLPHPTALRPTEPLFLRFRLGQIPGSLIQPSPSHNWPNLFPLDPVSVDPNSWLCDYGVSLCLCFLLSLALSLSYAGVWTSSLPISASINLYIFIPSCYIVQSSPPEPVLTSSSLSVPGAANSRAEPHTGRTEIWHDSIAFVLNSYGRQFIWKSHWSLFEGW